VLLVLVLRLVLVVMLLLLPVLVLLLMPGRRYDVIASCEATRRQIGNTCFFYATA